MQDFFSHCIRSWVQLWKLNSGKWNIHGGWKLYFVHPASTHPHVLDQDFLLRALRSCLTSFPSCWASKTNSSGLSGYPRPGERVYNSHWSLRPWADGPSRQRRASNLGLQLELLGKSIYLPIRVSKKVRFEFRGHCITTWSLRVSEQSEYSGGHSSEMERETLISSLT